MDIKSSEEYVGRLNTEGSAELRRRRRGKPLNKLSDTERIDFEIQEREFQEFLEAQIVPSEGEIEQLEIQSLADHLCVTYSEAWSYYYEGCEEEFEEEQRLIEMRELGTESEYYEDDGRNY